MRDEQELRLLLVDNDSAYMARLFDILALNHEVCVMNNPDDLFLETAFIQPDLIIMEMDFPEVDGVQVGRKLRRNPKTRNIPYLFLTRKDSPADIRLATMVNALDCLSKNSSIKEITMKLEKAIRQNGIKARPKTASIEQVYRYQQQMNHHSSRARNKAQEALHPEKENSISWQEMNERLMDPSRNKEPVHRLRILIADQDLQQTSTIESLLARCCDTIVTSSGVEALEKCSVYLPDIIILSLRLSHMPGFQVCETLRRHPTFSEAPIFGTLDETDRLKTAHMERYGFDTIFSLPADLEKLCLEVAKYAFDSEFKCHKYPMEYADVLKSEEDARLKVEKIRGEIDQTRRKAEIMQFLNQYGKD
ncbi:MAG: response regulator [Candidatus Sumerlaeia bacterium]